MTPFKKGGLALLLGLTAGLILILSYRLVGDLPVPTAESLRAVRPSTLILDRNGQLLYEAIGEAGKQTPLEFADIPAACWQATVAVEDSRFFQHGGVDLLAIGRAAWTNWRAGTIVSGASTLTQQLARSTLLSQEERFEPSLRRKLREAWLAWRIEQRLSKEEILALYHNQVYYGNFAYGLEAAAQAYYGKSARELDLAECSLLAGLPQNPAAYNPLQNLEAARWRQSIVLNRMVQEGMVDRADAQLALAEQLSFAASPFSIKAPHFVSYVSDQLERLLGTEVVARGGLRVITTLDAGWQHGAESSVRRRLRQLRDEPNAPADRQVDNAAVVTLDPSTGAIRVMVGSPDYFDATIDGAVNGAVALRQPGSALKPLTYAIAMDPAAARAMGREALTAASIIPDVRTSFLTAEGDPYVPQNYDLSWHGPVSARTALASSYNMPAVKLLDQIGVEALIDQAQRQGINTFHPGQRYGLALTLGGGEVRLLDLTGAYAAFANGGRRVEPYAIQQVDTLQGTTLFQARPGQPHSTSLTSDPNPATSGQRPALSPQVAYLISDILSDNDARAPSFGRHSVLRLSRPTAVKTGTTTDWRDNWTVGYTPDLVTGVWVGNADNTPMLGVSGVAGAGPIWHDVMELVHEHLPSRAFDQPPGLVRVEVCTDSGLLPTQWCSRRRSELFITGTEPADYDTVYQPVDVDTCSGTVASASTPSRCREVQVYRVYPPELREWAISQDIPLPPRQALAMEGEPEPETSSGLTISSPDPNRAYRLSDTLPAELQQIRLAAAWHGVDAPAQVTFLVNGLPVGQASEPPYEAWWTLQRGTFPITAIAEDKIGQKTVAETIWIEVR